MEIYDPALIASFLRHYHHLCKALILDRRHFWTHEPTFYTNNI
jgi:hypothetical protein